MNTKITFCWFVRIDPSELTRNWGQRMEFQHTGVQGLALHTQINTQSKQFMHKFRNFSKVCHSLHCSQQTIQDLPTEG